MNLTLLGILTVFCCFLVSVFLGTVVVIRARKPGKPVTFWAWASTAVAVVCIGYSWMGFLNMRFAENQVAYVFATILFLVFLYFEIAMLLRLIMAASSVADDTGGLSMRSGCMIDRVLVWWYGEDYASEYARKKSICDVAKYAALLFLFGLPVQILIASVFSFFSFLFCGTVFRMATTREINEFKRSHWGQDAPSFISRQLLNFSPLLALLQAAVIGYILWVSATWVLYLARISWPFVASYALLIAVSILFIFFSARHKQVTERYKRWYQYAEEREIKVSVPVAVTKPVTNAGRSFADLAREMFNTIDEVLGRTKDRACPLIRRG